MNIGNLIFTLPAWQKTLVRKTEKENKKIANTESSLVYNTTCLKENLLPTYTNIYICILWQQIFFNACSIEDQDQGTFNKSNFLVNFLNFSYLLLLFSR